MDKKQSVAIVWLRRDLRLHDHASLWHALHSGLPVLPLFIFDPEILSKLDSRRDARVLFIHRTVEAIKIKLESEGSSLLVLHADPISAFQELMERYDVREVHCSSDYEPYAVERDRRVHSILQQNGVRFISHKDQVIFDPSEVLKDDGLPYTIYTPYSRKWMARLELNGIRSYPTEERMDRFVKTPRLRFPSLTDLGFEDFSFPFPGSHVSEEMLENYHQHRDFPAVSGTSRLSLHLRFGTVSIRELVSEARAHSEKWLKELIWREFYQSILFHFPHTVDHAFKKEYDRIPWRNDEQEFESWCNGTTGYPLVDAGMRELRATGFMHNRVRMVVAGFLTKHLLIDWRWGERFFAKHLLDFELASNVGGWQWSAGCGCDAAPYFRVFNPTEQQKKFDPDHIYIRKWVEEFGTSDYPVAMVDHALARARVLSVYSQALRA